MKIENETLYINKTDLDHVLGELEGVGIFEEPPSEIFLRALHGELVFNGMEDEVFNKIIIKHVWE